MLPNKSLPQVLIIIPKQKEITHSSRTAFSEDIFPQQKGGGERIMELKKLPNLNLQGYWSKALIKSTIFAAFTFLVYVLLCHNLISSIMRCESSLTELINFSLRSRMCRNSYMKYTTLPTLYFNHFTHHMPN